jgi:hypothetical protein
MLAAGALSLAVACSHESDAAATSDVPRGDTA